MTLLYLLDTNVVSELTKPAPHGDVLRRFSEHEAQCALSAPTLDELVFGVERLTEGSRRLMLRRWLIGLLDHVEVLPFDALAAQWLGRERARLAARGTPAPRTDGEIAAMAATRQLTLVTRNTADFEVFDGLMLENWHLTTA